MERSGRGRRQPDVELPLSVLAPEVENQPLPPGWAASGASTAAVHAPQAPQAAHLADVHVESARTAFEDFYREARPSIARALALALGDVDLAIEATDEAFTRAYERWPVVSRCDRPAAWVYRVGMNWALSILRRRKRGDHKLYDPMVAEAAMVADPDVHAALAELDVKHRSVVVCRYLLGWPIADIAVALKIREGTVKSRLHRATKLLQVRLRRHHPQALAREERA